MRNFLLGALSLVTLNSSVAFALSLPEAMEMAKEKNPVVAQLRASESAADWQKTKAFSTFIPKITLQGQHLFSEKFQTLPVNLGTVPTPTPVEILMIQPYTQFTGRISWNIFEGLGGMRSYQAASLSYEAASLERQRAEMQIEKEVRTQFYQALGAQSLFEVAAQKVRALEEHKKDIDRTIRVGSGTKYDLLKIETQLAEAETDKMQAEDNVVLTRTALASLLGQEELPGDLIGDFFPVENVKLPEKFSKEVSNRSDIEAKIKKEEAALRESQMSKSWWFPKINLFAEKQFYNNFDKDWEYTNKFKDAYLVGVNFQWDIFDGGAAIANQMQSKYQSVIAKETTRAALLQYPQEVDRWRRKFNLSVAVYKSKSISIEKSQETVRLAKQGLRAGSLTNTDLLDAELELYTSRSRAVQARVDAIEALGNLELATGKSYY
ncbi:Outer membrane protein TolC precursor [compost metagenome]